MKTNGNGSDTEHDYSSTPLPLTSRFRLAASMDPESFSSQFDLIQEL